MTSIVPIQGVNYPKKCSIVEHEVFFAELNAFFKAAYTEPVKAQNMIRLDKKAINFFRVN